MGKETNFPPQLIAAPYPYLVIEDLNTTLGKFDDTFVKDKQINRLQRRLVDTQFKYAPQGSSLYSVSQVELINKVEQKVNKRLNDSDRIGILNFDRYILENNHESNHHRINLSRSPSGELVPRPGSSISKEEQIREVRLWLEKGKYDQVILADDVVAFATTFPAIVDLIKLTQPQAKVSAVVGICSSGGKWSGKEKLESANVSVDPVITIEASTEVKNGSSGMDVPDSRDSTVFGGKIGNTSERSLSFPYFYPFSTPSTSRIDSSKREEASMSWLEYNLDLIKYINKKLAINISMNNLESKGFGTPYTSVERFKEDIKIPKSNSSILEYLKMLIKITPSLFQKNVN